jgi:protein-S-isoprenylcysteine O-methyltransferase Ste14
MLSFVFIIGGFFLIAGAWRVLYDAQQRRELATTGPYNGFILIMFGFLLQWPTILTLAMFPVLVWMYVHLARQEEREAFATFGKAYADYAARVPAFIPRLTRIVQHTG